MSISVERLTKFLVSKNLSGPFEFSNIPGGRNSKLVKVKNYYGSWVIKSYPSINGDHKNRLCKEVRFLKYLEVKGIGCVPRVLGYDISLGVALYTFMDGQKLSQIKNNHLDQAINFIRKINESKFSLRSLLLPRATGACFCIQDYIRDLDKRLISLGDAVKTTPSLFEINDFFKAHINKEWAFVKEEILSKISNDINIRYSDRIISPSDFGYHNAIEDYGELKFFDFEYAGWDDPAKLIADFICQPDFPISKDHEHYFLNEICKMLPLGDKILERVNIVLPLCRLKWISIVLGVAVRGIRSPQPEEIKLELIADQLKKAQSYFLKSKN